MKRFAILLGTEEYDFLQPTAFCHNDVILLKKTLIDYCDFAEQDVYDKLLSPKDDLQPTEILLEIKKLVDKSQVGDTVLFYYAGHGAYFSGDSYLILPNTKPDNIEKTSIPLRDISDLLRNDGIINVRIFDTCHSGQDVRANLIPNLNFKDFARDILTGSTSGWITLAACRENEYSYPDPRFGNGVFTYYLAEAIKEFEDEQDIFPEILKVKVCEKVLNWCSQNMITQTPTFNSAISGNISIAKRKPMVVTQIQAPQVKKVVDIDQDLKERLASARKFEKIGNDKHKQVLLEYISFAHKTIGDKIKTIDLFGLEPIITKLMNADHISYEIKPMITSVILPKKLKTLHTIEVYKEYEKKKSTPIPMPYKQLLEGLSSVFQTSEEPEVKSIHYIIEQDNSLPESCFEIEYIGDGYLPYGKMFIYCIPLLTCLCLVSGLIIRFNDNPSHDEMKEYVLQPMFLGLDLANDSPKIITLIDELLSRFIDIFKELTEKRLNYLEWESKQVQK